VIGKGRALFRIKDLMELVRLLETLVRIRKGKGVGVK